MKHAPLYLVAGFILVIGSTLFIWPQLSLFLASDSCLGAGGSFDFSQFRCDFQQNHPYVTFKLWPFWAAFLGALAGFTLIGKSLVGFRRYKSLKSKPHRFDAGMA